MWNDSFVSDTHSDEDKVIKLQQLSLDLCFSSAACVELERRMCFKDKILLRALLVFRRSLLGAFSAVLSSVLHSISFSAQIDLVFSGESSEGLKDIVHQLRAQKSFLRPAQLLRPPADWMHRHTPASRHCTFPFSRSASYPAACSTSCRTLAPQTHFSLWVMMSTNDAHPPVLPNKP